MGNSCGGFKEYWDLVRKYPKFQGGFIWDFVDQALHGNDSEGRAIYKYGGDYNSYDASDNNFNCNGLISPDRVPNPHMYEVGYYYQNIWTSLSEADWVSLSVHNEFFFRNLDNVCLQWCLMKEDQVIKQGTIERLNIAPQQTATVALPIAKKELEGTLLNVYFKLKKAEPLMDAGQTIAYQQFGSVPVSNAALADNGKVKGKTDKKRGILTVTGNDFTAVFDMKSGQLSQWKVGGHDVLAEGGTIRPNFWRAPTDNDMGAQIHRKYAVWRNPAANLRSIAWDKKQHTVTTVFDMPDVKSALTMTYRLLSDGRMVVSEQLTPEAGATAPNMMRFGHPAALRYGSKYLLRTWTGGELCRPQVFAAHRRLSPDGRRTVLSLCEAAGDGNQERHGMVEADQQGRLRIAH